MEEGPPGLAVLGRLMRSFVVFRAEGWKLITLQGDRLHALLDSFAIAVMISYFAIGYDCVLNSFFNGLRLVKGH